MMRRGLKIGLLLATPPVVGVLLVWACVAALGLIAAFVGEHRLFGLPVTRVMFWEDVAAWVPLSIATGWALTLVSPRGWVAPAWQKRGDQGRPLRRVGLNGR